eukprot:4440021-Alexandrium_andersonii.AAC.1
MSASLVGSEMCIRDRPGEAKSGLRPAGVGGPVGPRHQGALGLPRARGPVSYTHLTLPTICSV